MNDASQEFPLNIVQGATLIIEITFYDPDGNVVNLTSYTADMIFRKTVEDTGDPIIELSTENGLIVINGTAGTITFTLPANQSVLLFNEQEMVYNLFINSPTNVITPLLAGPAYVQGSTIR